MKRPSKRLVLIFVLGLLSGCIEGGPSFNATASSVALTSPGTVYQGGSYTFSGSCAPNGTSVNISLPSATPSLISNCVCTAGAFSCPATTLSTVPTPSLDIQAQSTEGATSEVTVASYVPSVSLNDPGYISSGDSVTFSGTCSPDVLPVDITIASATPASIQDCPCSGGTFSCPPTVLTGLSTPAMLTSASNYTSSSSSQNVFTSRTAYATAATTPGAYGTNMTMALDLTGPSSLPGNIVSITSTCYNGGTCNFGSWNPGGNTVGGFSLLGFSFSTSDIFPSDNSPAYLDVTGNMNRTLDINFGATPLSLDTAGSKYYFWIAVAGLGASPEFVTVTSNRTLQVIGYQDSFGTGDYSYLDGAATSLGSTGTAISTKPASGANGYTFYLIEDRSASTIQLSYVHGGTPDFHGFILGAIEVRNQ